MTAFARSRTLLAFLSSVGILTVSGGALLAATQYSAKTDWTVSSDSAQGYCTAVQGFSSDAVITIAQRPDDAISVAFDFQKSIFDTSKNYTAKITANGTSRTFTTRTASPTALVIAVGIDEAFFNALKSASTLSLNVDSKDYAFAMGNASAGLSALKPCLAALNTAGGTQVASAPSAPSAPAAPVPAVSSSGNASLAAENASLKAALADMRRNYENLSSQGGSSARTIELEEKLAQAQTEIRNLQSQVKTVPSAAPQGQGLPGAEAAAQMAALQDEVNALKTERDQLKAQTQTASANPQATQEVAEIKTEMARQVNELNAQIAGLKQQNAALNASLETAKATPQAPAVDPAKEAQLTNLQNEKVALQAQIDQLSTQNAKLTGDLAQAKTGDTAAYQEVAALKAQVAQLTAQNAALSQQAAKSGTADTQSAAEIGQLNAKVTQLENEKAALQGTVSSLNQQVADLNAASVGTAGASAETDSALTAQVTSLQSQNSALQAQITQLNAQLANAAAAPSDADAGDAEELREQLRVSRADVDRLLAENGKLTSDIAQLQNASASESAAMASGDWNLEQATRRYQESQREIRRLGSLLEQQRGKCEQEKKDIEYMLFDPKLTEDGQIAVLNSLEDQLDVAQNRVRDLEMKYNEPMSLMPPRPQVASAFPAAASASGTAAIPAVAGTPMRNGASSAGANMISVAGGASTPDQDYFRTLLTSANVNYGDLNAAPEAPGSFTWVVDNSLYGTAKETPMSGSFQNMVDAYIANVKNRCDGEFASVPVSTGNANPGNARQAYEIACVDGKGGLSASLLFYQYDNMFISIAHEGATDRMEQAMEVRDRLDKAVQTSS